MDSGSRNIVVVGAGYGGITAVLRLARLFHLSPEYRVHLIDKNPFHTLKTQLHEAAIHKHEVTIDIGRIIHKRNVDFHLGAVSAIDLVGRRIEVDGKSLPFEYLVLALGSQANFYNIPGLEKFAFPLQSASDAERIYQHISLTCADASSEEDAVRRREMLRFIVGGGGLSGIELAGELVDHVRQCTQNNQIPAEEAEIILVEASDRILPSSDTSLRERIQQKLNQKGVKVRINTAVTSLSHDSVALSTGEVLKSSTLVWTGGIRIADIAHESGIKTGQSGRIVVDAYLRSADYPSIFAIGDNALAMNRHTGKAVPAAAQFALQQGRLVADNIWSAVNGRELKAYEPKVWGEVVSLGRHLAVGWLALPLSRKITFVGFLGNLLRAAVEEKHVILLRKESRNWITY